MAKFAFLTTKLQIPVPSPNLVPRPHLLLQLNEGLKLGHKLTLVSAPAGFGKTNLLSEWTASPGVSHRVAWFSLDQEDNHPSRFWAYVITALQTVLDGVGETTSVLLRSLDQTSTEAILTPLLNEIAAQPHFTLLVLDDYHLIHRDEIHRGVTFVLENLPPQFHLAIATRADPPLPVVRLRARGQLTELRGDDLRFSLDETRCFLNAQMGIGLLEADLKALDKRIEGWITGLQLAAFSIRGSVEKQEFVSSFAGSHYYILEYLFEEVISQLPEDLFQFLIQTSILDPLCASLCDKVAGRCDSGELLTRLYHENLFITALDYDHTWFRYHQLFSDLLNNHLFQKLDRKIIADLHQRASAWYEEHGYLQAAVKHAQDAGDHARVAELAEQAAQFSQIDSWMTNLLDWLEYLPEDDLTRRPRLRIYQALAYFFDGQSAKCLEILKETRQSIQDLPPSRENDLLQDELSQLIDIIYTFDTVLSLSMRGKLKKAQQVLIHKAPLVKETGNEFLYAHVLHGTALCQYHQGKVREAELTSKELIRHAGDNLREPNQVQPLPVAVAGHLLLAGIYLDQNRLEEMEQVVDRAFELCRESGGAKILVETYVMRSRLQQAQGDLEKAYQSISKAEQAYFLKESLTRFRLESQKARLDVEAGLYEEAYRWLNRLNVVDQESKSPAVLPTLLSEAARLILARLYLSQHKHDHALWILDRIQSSAEAEGRYRHVLETYTLKALAFQVTHQSQAALTYIEKALKLAGVEDMQRIFLDCNFLDKGVPMQQLLYTAAGRGIKKEFIKRLFITLPSMETAVRGSKTNLVEALSKRELDVLQLLANGYTNRQISQNMVISLNTVKTHNSNIYSKLDANNRIQAVIKAKALGLID